MGWAGPMTHRQFLSWAAWLEAEWDRPSRSDVYQMQTAHEARYAFAKKRPRFASKDYTLPFTTGKPADGMTREQAAAIAKAAWGARLGREIKTVKGGQEGG